MKKYAPLIICIATIANANTYQTSQNGNLLTINCDQNNNCQLQAINHSTSKQVTISGKYLLTEKSTVLWHGANLIEITTGNGSENFITAFFDFQLMRYQGGFYNMVFVDAAKNIVIAEDDKANTFVMECIFDQNIQPETVLNDASYGVLDWGSFNMIGSNQVKFGYYDDQNNYQYKTITLDLACNQNN